MVKKSISALTFIVLMSMLIAPVITSQDSVSQIRSSTRIWYVGGNGPGNFSEIQQAIDNANVNDTIFVYNGTYPEHILIDKTIHLIGENSSQTIIDGESLGDIVLITADGVILSNVSIQHGGSAVNDAAIKIQSNNNTITRTNISENGNDGILLENASYNNLIHNRFFSNGYHAISLNDGSNHNLIKANTIVNTTYRGIVLINHCINNSIEDNQIRKTQIFYPIFCKLYCSQNQIINNTLIDNANIAIQLESQSNHNQISSNKIFDNLAGIYLFESYHTHIYRNFIVNNSRNGIRLGDQIQQKKAQETIIESNIIQSHPESGILIEYLSSNNTIFNNTISDNENGIEIRFSSHSNHIFHNNIFNNSLNAVDECINTYDKGYPLGGNYWDDYTGLDQDQDGFGDEPYEVNGGDNTDRYPFMDPLGNLGINTIPHASFLYTPPDPTDLDFISFTDTSNDSDGSIVSWLWDFGDGNSSHLRNPVHQYGDDGFFTVMLTITDNNNSKNFTTQQLLISNVGPTAQFHVSTDQTTPGKTIEFTDESTDPDGSIETWYWEFGDGSTSFLRNPSHEYDTFGTFQVNLTVNDDDMALGTYAKNISIIDTNIPPTANFTIEPENPYKDDVIFFNSTSTDDALISNFTWNFGDETKGYAANTTHQFQDVNTYQVRLRVTDVNGSTDTIIKQVTTKPLITVSINSPDNKSSVSERVEIRGTVDSKNSINSVKIRFDQGSWKDIEGAIEWSYLWDTTELENGSYLVTVNATDETGNYAVDSITVFLENTVVNHKPSIEITYPQHQDTISDSIIVSGSASDADGEVVSVDVRIDQGSWDSAQLAGSTWEYQLDSSQYEDGSHILYARSFDGSSYSSVSSTPFSIQNQIDDTDDEVPDGTTDEPNDQQKDDAIDDSDNEDDSSSDENDSSLPEFLVIVFSAFMGAIIAIVVIIRI